MTFKGGAGWLNRKIICKQCKNEATSKSYIELIIVLFVQLINRNHLWPQ